MAVELKKVKHPINGFNWSGVRTDCHPTSPTWSHGQQTKRKQMFGTLRLAGRWIYFIFPLHRIFNIFSQLFQVLADSHATWECPALHFIRKWLKFSSDLKVKIGPVPLNRPLNFLKILEITKLGTLELLKMELLVTSEMKRYKTSMFFVKIYKTVKSRILLVHPGRIYYFLAFYVNLS